MTIRIAIIGTGGMAQQHAQKFKEISGVELVAACDVSEERVSAFAKQYGIPETYTSAEKLLADSNCEAVSIVTPDSTHAKLSLLALAAGKHVLCEKPLATNAADADEMAKAAAASKKIHMVNLSYRNSSAWQRLLEMVEAGELGTIRHFEGYYRQCWLSTKDWGDWKTTPAWLWRLSTAHGSKGALGDVGVHILDFATRPVGDVVQLFCHLKTFDKAPGGKIQDYVLDANDTALITCECAGGAVGTIAITRWATGHQNSVALTVHGDKAAVRIDLDQSYEMMEVCRVLEDGKSSPWEHIYCGKTPNMWARFVQSIQSGTNDQPDFLRGAQVQHYLDACEASHAKGGFVAL